MPDFQSIFRLFTCILCAIAVADLGVVGFLLHWGYASTNKQRQVYVLSDPRLNVLESMSVVPGWTLVGSYWFTIAASTIAVIETPMLIMILSHKRKTERRPWSQISLSFFSSLAVAFFSFLNIITSVTALAWLLRQDRGVHDPGTQYGDFSSSAPTFGQYNQYTSSAGFTVGAFSCALAKAAFDTQGTDLRELCRIGKVPSRLLVTHVAVSGVTLLLTLVSWVGPTIHRRIRASESMLKKEAVDQEGRSNATSQPGSRSRDWA